MQQLTNFLQFKGDYELYSTAAFSSRGPGAGGGPLGRMRERDPDQPSPMQPARQKYLRESVYAGKSPRDLKQEQQRIAREALWEGRRAFVMAPVSLLSSFRSIFDPGDEFELVPVARWKEPVALPTELQSTALMPQQRGFGGGGPGPGPGPGGRAQQTWRLMEIKPKAHAPAAAPGAGILL